MLHTPHAFNVSVPRYMLSHYLYTYSLWRDFFNAWMKYHCVYNMKKTSWCFMLCLPYLRVSFCININIQRSEHLRSCTWMQCCFAVKNGNKRNVWKKCPKCWGGKYCLKKKKNKFNVFVFDFGRGTIMFSHLASSERRKSPKKKKKKKKVFGTQWG